MGKCIGLIKAQMGTIFRSKTKACRYRSHKLCVVPDSHGKTAVRQSMKNQSTGTKLMPFHMALWKTALIKIVSLMRSSMIKYVNTVTSDFFNIFDLITDDILGFFWAI